MQFMNKVCQKISQATSAKHFLLCIKINCNLGNFCNCCYWTTTDQPLHHSPSLSWGETAKSQTHTVHNTPLPCLFTHPRALQPGSGKAQAGARQGHEGDWTRGDPLSGGELLVFPLPARNTEGAMLAVPADQDSSISWTSLNTKKNCILSYKQKLAMDWPSYTKTIDK